MKIYIRDRKGAVSECIANISKMNVLEYQYYNLRYWGYYRKSCVWVVELLMATMWGVVALVLLSVMLLNLLCPVGGMAGAWKRIRNSRETIEFLESESSIVLATEIDKKTGLETMIKHDKNYHPENEKGVSHERND